jgi:hypothetical protein
MMWIYAALAASSAAILLVLRARRVGEARTLARGLIPEIRALMASCEAGAPLARDSSASVRASAILSKEAAYAVAAFYDSVDEYADASREMLAAFEKDSTLSLGDKVRAKDRRDRSLKDVYYSGEGALERLSKLS